MKDLANKIILEHKRLGLSNQGIINLINGMMMNNIDDKNMLLCLEIKKQLS